MMLSTTRFKQCKIINLAQFFYTAFDLEIIEWQEAGLMRPSVVMVSLTTNKE
jgi:hypothetical protein